MDSEATSDDRKAGRAANGTVLVVDDDEQVRRLSGRMFSQLGFEVVVAEDGRTAIDLFAKREAGFDCVLLDLGLPGIDGEQVGKALRAIDPHIPIIVSSGFGPTDVLERMAASGFVEFLPKPYGLDQLRASLRSAMDR